MADYKQNTTGKRIVQAFFSFTFNSFFYRKVEKVEYVVKEEATFSEFLPLTSSTSRLKFQPIFGLTVNLPQKKRPPGTPGYPGRPGRPYTTRFSLPL
jgi:hypothetical protein